MERSNWNLENIFLLFFRLHQQVVKSIIKNPPERDIVMKKRTSLEFPKSNPLLLTQCNKRGQLSTKDKVLNVNVNMSLVQRFQFIHMMRERNFKNVSQNQINQFYW